MSVTVRDALGLPAFDGGGAQVLAGESGLTREIRWVHVAELPDIAPLLKGGELLLTTGMGLGGGPAPRRRYVRQLAEAGIAGLVVELGRNFARMPPEMVDAAEGYGVPLIALHREIRFVEATEQVHHAIMDRQYELLSRVDAFNREFAGLLLGGAGIEQILHGLSEAVGNPVVMENGAHQVVGAAPRSGPAIDEALSGWQEHSRTGHSQDGPGAVHRARHCSPECIWVDIWLRHERWGRIHVLRGEHRLDQATTLLLDRAGTAVGLSVLSQQDAEHLADRAASAVIADLLTGRFGSPEELLRRARSLGSHLPHGGLAALIVDATNLATVAREQRLTEQQCQHVRLQMHSRLQQALARHDCVGLLGLDADRVLAVVASRGRKPAAAVLERVAADVREHLARDVADLTVVIGASRQASAASLQHAFEEARIAVEFGHHGGPKNLYRFGDLGVYPLLLRLAGDPTLAAFVESELGPVLAHDASSSAKLLPTLRAYLAHAGHKSRSAAALNIQRRTLYARLARLERLLQRDLERQDSRTGLDIALQGFDILGEHSASRSAARPPRG